MTTKTLPSNKIQLTEEQQKAVNDLLEWVNKPYNKEDERYRMPLLRQRTRH